MLLEVERVEQRERERERERERGREIPFGVRWVLVRSIADSQRMQWYDVIRYHNPLISLQTLDILTAM